MNAEFEVAACHNDRAGKAHLVVRHAGGAEIAIQHVPFESVADEGLEQEQRRILTEAARVAHEAADFLAAETTTLKSFPTLAAKPGAAPRLDEGDDSAEPVLGRS